MTFGEIGAAGVEEYPYDPFTLLETLRPLTG